MSKNLIKYWSKKIFFAIAIINTIIMLIFLILSSILIPTTAEKVITIVLVLIINVIILIILYGFSTNTNSYEVIYQLKINKNQKTKLIRYLLILFTFLWLTFFLGNTIYMFGYAIAFQNELDYFASLKNNWWKLLIVAFYHTSLVVIHRQILRITIKRQIPTREK